MMTRLILHGVRVDLAHVLAAVLLLDLSDVQVEGGEEVARDGDAPIVRDDGVVDRQDLLQVGLHPRHLRDRGIEDEMHSEDFFTQLTPSVYFAFHSHALEEKVGDTH